MSSTSGNDSRVNGMEAFLGQGSKITGNISFSGPAELNGQVEGELKSTDRLVIGESAIVNAKVEGVEVVVKGTVNGDISASQKLSLKKPARVTGNISSSNLSIEEGVIFEGRCSMSSKLAKIESKSDDIARGNLSKPFGAAKVGASA